MARLIKQAPFGIYIVLDGSVGAGGTNAREDVGIVQYALAILSGGGVVQPHPGKSKSIFTVPGQQPISVDGSYGPQTAAYIAAYQRSRKDLMGPGATGLPPPNGMFAGRKGGSGWRFQVLNEDVRHSRQRDLLDILQSDVGAKPWLREAFFA